MSDWSEVEGMLTLAELNWKIAIDYLDDAIEELREVQKQLNAGIRMARYINGEYNN